MSTVPSRKTNKTVAVLMLLRALGCVALLVVASASTEEDSGGGAPLDEAADDVGLGLDLGLTNDLYEAFLDADSGVFTTIAIDPESDDGRDHRRHHVRRTLLANDCVGIPKFFRETFFVSVYDALSLIDSETNLARLERVLLRVLNEKCLAASCVEVTDLSIVRVNYVEMAQTSARRLASKAEEGVEAWRSLQREDVRAGRTGSQVVSMKTDVTGKCSMCKIPGGGTLDGEESVLFADGGITRDVGRRALRRALTSCSDHLRDTLANGDDEDFRCVTAVALSKIDPRCF